MRSLLVLVVLILGTSFVAKASNLQKVEIQTESVRIIDQRELGARRFELTLEFEVTTPVCIEQFVGLVKDQENSFIPVADIADECEKHLFAKVAQAKIEVGIFTKSLPARDSIKIGKNIVWLEEDFGQVSVIK